MFLPQVRKVRRLSCRLNSPGWQSSPVDPHRTLQISHSLSGLGHREQSEEISHLLQFLIYFYLSEHDKGLLNPGEDLEGDVWGSALCEGVIVGDD